jgi:predicted nucleic acid-binding protein
MRYSVHALSIMQHQKQQIRRYLQKLNMQQTIFDLATQFIREYRLSHGLALPDAVIGATAIYYQMPLFTYNRKDFRFLPEIQLADDN